MDDLERVRAALERVIGQPMKMFSRDEWDASLREGGKPTRLDAPYTPYRGVQDNPGYESAVASGVPYAGEPGFHHTRRDEKDGPEGLFNTDSHHVIEDLVGEPMWSEVLRVAGLEPSADLVERVRGQVFGHLKNRSDHRNPTVPTDIAAAEPKESARPPGEPSGG